MRGFINTLLHKNCEPVVSRNDEQVTQSIAGAVERHGLAVDRLTDAIKELLDESQALRDARRH